MNVFRYFLSLILIFKSQDHTTAALGIASLQRYCRRIIGAVGAASCICAHSVAAADESKVMQLFEDARPSVVNINTFVAKVDSLSLNVMEVPAGTGSGFVWDRDGHIVTNYHVIRNAAAAKVSLLSHVTLLGAISHLALRR